MMNKPLVLSIFCGVGGLCYGFDLAGFDVALAVDIDPLNVQTHQQNFPSGKTVCQPVENLNAVSVDQLMEGRRPIDVIIGGPPCQSFSVSGKRDSADPRASLITQFVRLVGLIRPKYFVLENVKGLTQGHCKQVLETAIAQFEALGYQLPPWQVLNAKNYGVPQHRERLFLLGSREDQPLLSYPRPQQTIVTVREALQDIPNADDKRYQMDAGRLRYANTSPSTYGLRMRARSGSACPSSDLLNNCQSTEHSANVRERFANLPPGRRDPISHCDRLNPDGVSPTITAGSQASRHTARRPIHYEHDRVITPREAARLSGFPDSFIFPLQKWHAFRQIGNAVPPPLAKAIALEVIKPFLKNYVK